MWAGRGQTAASHGKNLAVLTLVKYIIELMGILQESFPLRFLSSPRRRILALLRLDDRTVTELARELAVSSNAVRSHLAALERDGVVDQGDVRRESVGKPARTYSLSTAGEELFARAYAPMLLCLIGLARGVGWSGRVDLGAGRCWCAPRCWLSGWMAVRRGRCALRSWG